ncbi:hypothetical protein EGW08_009818 [Elysia chlorotica]|uniref:Uncharacterized protein n=1 Tax=Elysia chlorotica TaxID=188477 RepID=A0A433TLG4_ELYCH|nr:hypothetical protein EGW08_009818 [Elysia chlorotica]
MKSFGWRRKAGAKVSKQLTQAFSADVKDEESASENESDWLPFAPRKVALSLEDANAKSERLKVEGAILAEAERYWEALKKWEEAIQLTPNNHKILDMKAQALMAVGEVFPALQTAEKTVRISPTWWVGHQTLGRALANVGEVKMAQRSFTRAVHLNPGNPELWTEDLLWVKSLLDRHKLTQTKQLQEELSGMVGSTSKSTVMITELKEKDDNGSTLEDIENLSVINYNRNDVVGSDNENLGPSAPKKVRSLPKNYVQMREPT